MGRKESLIAKYNMLEYKKFDLEKQFNEDAIICEDYRDIECCEGDCSNCYANRVLEEHKNKIKKIEKKMNRIKKQFENLEKNHYY